MNNRFDSMKIIRSFRKVLLAKQEFVMGKNCVIYKTANIVNPFQDKNRIMLGICCHIRGEILLFGHGGRIIMGDYCYVGSNTYIWSARNVTIGNRVLISHNCNIFDNDTHPLEPGARHEQFKKIITTGQPRDIDLKEETVVIEDDVLISANSTILKGVTIGRAAVVGAGSVVTHDVPPGVVVAGNPARVIRKLEFGETCAL